jgi:tRNA A-37 threonylcarbamoyl transferase component Bud32
VALPPPHIDRSVACDAASLHARAQIAVVSVGKHPKAAVHAAGSLPPRGSGRVQAAPARELPDARHCPDTQVSAVAQARSQAPQCAAEAPRSTHRPPHSDRGRAHSGASGPASAGASGGGRSGGAAPSGGSTSGGATSGPPASSTSSGAAASASGGAAPSSAASAASAVAPSGGVDGELRAPRVRRPHADRTDLEGAARRGAEGQREAEEASVGGRHAGSLAQLRGADAQPAAVARLPAGRAVAYAADVPSPRAMTAADHDPFYPGGSFGPYDILERIGEGAMASVWRATHRGLRKPVAIKALRLEQAQNARARDRFLREGEAISRIRHAHVVEVHDLGVVGDSLYLVMEYLEGEDLRSFFLRSGPLAPGALADLLVPVCAAVAAAHDESVIHRDLKPANIFLAHTRDRGVVPKVLDFGISRVEDGSQGHTAASTLLGTPRYMAPEMVRGGRFADKRSDQYSLGVMLYQGATGQVPVDDVNLYELLRRIASGAITPPRALRPELPAGFEAVILRALALRPDDRFPSVRDLGAALLPYASERTRVLHGDALGGAPYEAPPRVATPAAPAVVDTHSLTLAGAPLELPAARPQGPAAPAWALAAAAALVVVGAFGALWWLRPAEAPHAVAAPPVLPLAPRAPAPVAAAAPGRRAAPCPDGLPRRPARRARGAAPGGECATAGASAPQRRARRDAAAGAADRRRRGGQRA